MLIRLLLPSLLTTLLMTAHSPAGAAERLTMKPGKSHGFVVVRGRKRTFRLHIPKQFPADKKLPLVIVLHGALGCGWTGDWDSRMSEQAEKEQFIVAYPNAYTRTWNAGGCCGLARRWKVDDVGFMRAMIDRLKSELPIDEKRVFVTGISNGGMMAFRLGRELSDKIAAIAPIQGCMYRSQTDLDIPVSVIVFHGTNDSIIRYDGGTGSKFGYKVTAQSVADTIKFWVKHNECQTTPVREENGNVVKDLYRGGKSGTEVCLYTVKGGGHAWPGGRRCVPAGDRPSKELSATEVMCEFFKSHPKQGTMRESTAGAHSGAASNPGTTNGG